MAMTGLEDRKMVCGLAGFPLPESESPICPRPPSVLTTRLLVSANTAAGCIYTGNL